MEELIKATAWRMTPPSAYGSFHLSFFLIGLLVSLGLAILLRRTTDRQNKVVLLVCGLFLVLSEIYKHLFYYYVVGEGSYPWWIFPFQLCSVPMYICLIAPFLKKGGVQQALYNFMISYNFLGGFVAFLEPSGLVHGYWTLTLHAFTWHMLLVFIGLYLVMSGRAGRRISDFKPVVLSFVVMCAIAFCINLILWQVAKGDINMFYVGPATSPIVVFKDIAEKYGWYVNTPIYMALMTLGAFIFYAPFCALRRHMDKKRLTARPA